MILLHSTLWVQHPIVLIALIVPVGDRIASNIFLQYVMHLVHFLQRFYQWILAATVSCDLHFRSVVLQHVVVGVFALPWVRFTSVTVLDAFPARVEFLLDPS
jgi:ABC-type maltose transport system permease subunit